MKRIKFLCAVILSSIAMTGMTWASPERRGCLTECTARIGIVSAFGQEAGILVARTTSRKTWIVNGNRFTTGILRGNAVVIVLSGVSMINSAMITQVMLDHFKVERLIMSGIAGGVNPAHHVGDVIVPDRWAMPMEVYWNRDDKLPSPCGRAGDVACLGLKLAGIDGKPYPPYVAPAAAGREPTPGLFLRDNFVMTIGGSTQGEFRFDYPVDGTMLSVARSIRPVLERCGPKARERPDAPPNPKFCIKSQPRVVVGGRGVSGTAFLADPGYRTYLFTQLQAEAVEMETAALAHVAYANGIPYIAFRSLSDLAGAQGFDPDSVALFVSGLAETNEAAVTLAFLDSWAVRAKHR